MHLGKTKVTPKSRRQPTQTFFQARAHVAHRVTSCRGGGGAPEDSEVVQQVRGSQDRQIGQLEEGGYGTQSALKVQDDEEVYAGQSAQGKLSDKVIGTAGDVEDVEGEILRPSSNISSERLSVTSKNYSNLIHVKPAPAMTAKDI